MSKYETLEQVMGLGDQLHVTCACGHEGVFGKNDAITLFGADATPYDIRRRPMRCTKCHEVGKISVWI